MISLVQLWLQGVRENYLLAMQSGRGRGAGRRGRGALRARGRGDDDETRRAPLRRAAPEDDTTPVAADDDDAFFFRHVPMLNRQESHAALHTAAANLLEAMQAMQAACHALEASDAELGMLWPIVLDQCIQASLVSAQTARRVSRMARGLD